MLFINWRLTIKRANKTGNALSLKEQVKLWLEEEQKVI